MFADIEKISEEKRMAIDLQINIQGLKKQISHFAYIKEINQLGFDRVLLNILKKTFRNLLYLTNSTIFMQKTDLFYKNDL